MEIQLKLSYEDIYQQPPLSYTQNCPVNKTFYNRTDILKLMYDSNLLEQAFR